MRWLASQLKDRVGRVNPRRMTAAHLAWLVACWLLTIAIAVVLLVPGLMEQVVTRRQSPEHALDVLIAPAWFRCLVVAVGAVLAGALVILTELRRAESSRHRAGRPLTAEAILASATVFPAIALLANRDVVAAIVSGLFFVMVEVVVHLERTLGFSSRVGIAALGAVGAWAVLFFVQLSPGAGAPGDWTWIALFGLSAAGAAFVAYYEVQRAAESRTRPFRRLFRNQLRTGVVLAIGLVVVGLVVLRLTVAQDLLPEPDPTLWSPFEKPPISWLHALLVATVLTVIALRSNRRPLSRRGDRQITAGLSVVGNIELELSAAVIVIGLVIAAISGVALLPDEWVEWVPALKVAGVVVVGVVALTPPLRGTAARWLGIVSFLYLLPFTTAILLTASGVHLPPGLAGFPATPVQIMMLTLAAALVLTLVRMARRADSPSSGILVRLLVIPFVAVHAGWLLPAAWSGLVRVVVVISVLLALLFLLPPREARPERETQRLLGASAVQLLVITTFALAVPSLFDDPTQSVLGLVWLAVTTTASLTFDTVERVEHERNGPPSEDDGPSEEVSVD